LLVVDGGTLLIGDDTPRHVAAAAVAVAVAAAVAAAVVAAAA
jgi:hypothetical protein